MKNLSILLLPVILITGCQTINIVNGTDTQSPAQSTPLPKYQQDEWHHIGIARLVEYSGPVDLNERCKGKEWTAVRTRQSTGQVFLGLIPYLNFAWSPREVAIACKE